MLQDLNIYYRTEKNSVTLIFYLFNRIVLFLFLLWGLFFLGKVCESELLGLKTMTLKWHFISRCGKKARVKWRITSSLVHQSQLGVIKNPELTVGEHSRAAERSVFMQTP